MLISFILSLVLFLIYIYKFKGLYQTERKEGPINHKKKNGTITMGGIVIILSFIIPFLFIMNRFERLDFFFLILPMLSFFSIGLIDDILIVKYKKNDGLNPFLRIFFEMIFSILFYFMFKKINNLNYVEFYKYEINLGIFYIFFFILLFLSTSNATNITDGIDGLLGGIYLIVLMFFFIISIIKKETIITYLTMTLIGSISGFLYFNLPKAKVFMGDSGSLMIGASIVSIALYLKMELYLILLLIIPLIETLSVILQVMYFKISGGKRLFKMAPFHHHLELVGFSEKKIISLFFFITIVFCLIVYIIYV